VSSNNISLAIGLALAGLSANSFAATFTVDRIDDDPAFFNCDQSANFDCTLRGAIIASNISPGPDIILVPASTFELTVVGADEDAAATGDLDLLGEVLLQGAGASLTIIDAGGDTGLGDRVFEVRQNATVTISKVTIQGGRGGTSGGGGIRSSGAAILVDSTVSDNTAQVGGGIFTSSVQGSTFTMRNSVVQGNDADNSKGLGQGAGLQNEGMMIIEGSVIRENGLGGETSFGGGVANAGVLEISHTIILGNRAEQGGGLFQFLLFSTSISNSELTDNIADQFGGGASNSGGQLTLENSTLSGNAIPSSGQGGGLWNADLTQIVNSTISGNTVDGGTSGSGGGIHNSASGTLELSHTTIADNSALSGDALLNLGSVVVSNAVIQAPGLGTEPCSGNPVASLGGNIESADPLLETSGADSCGLDQPSDQVHVEIVELNLGPLAGNGGPTRTRALLQGSFAINAGVSSECQYLDQRGWVRVDGNCDVGAFEVGADPVLIFADGFESGDTSAWSGNQQ